MQAFEQLRPYFLKYYNQLVMWIYIHSEHSADHDVFTVGFYSPNGSLHTDGDYSTREEAAARVHYLNGGNNIQLH